eukprot:CAMPEP_0178383712 /NCGR_PEP_ID=MMETSP0689_2-20121128/7140_1 /TAXON_ID=160604 /ORGANISM="Amphidinium massartii, Strain CS-259" /LENGTH=1079 /DNA_ID=CAMNT_0020003935 /DNA_START=42 /DNA_END=3283 /DNA_ORIENTATION=+
MEHPRLFLPPAGSRAMREPSPEEASHSHSVPATRATRKLKTTGSAASLTSADHVGSTLADIREGIKSIQSTQRSLLEGLHRLESGHHMHQDAVLLSAKPDMFGRLVTPGQHSSAASPTRLARGKSHERGSHQMVPLSLTQVHSGAFHSMHSQTPGFASRGDESDGAGSVAKKLNTSPQDVWPKTVRLRPDIARLEAAQHGKAELGGSRMSRAHSSLNLEEFKVDSAEMGTLLHFYAKLFPLDADSNVMLGFDVCSLLLLILDVLVTPYLIVFEIGSTVATDIFDWGLAFWWCLDFLLGFVTAISDDHVGEAAEGVAAEVAKEYMGRGVRSKSSSAAFRLDCTQCDGVQQVNWGTCGRLEGCSANLQGLSPVEASALDSEAAAVVVAWSEADLDRSRASVENYAGCVALQPRGVMYLDSIGRHAPSDTDARWTEFVYHDFDSHMSEYMTALHWTLCQMTPGPVSIVAVNSAERAFNCVLLVAGLLFGGLLVSIMSGQIMQVLIRKRDKVDKLMLLDRFLRQHSIPPSLAFHVQRQVRRRIAVEAPIAETEVPVLKLLSSSLHSNLIHEMRKPHLVQHQLFMVLSIFETGALERICETSVKFLFHPPEDELFKAAEEGLRAVTVIGGEVVYRQNPETSRLETSTEVFVQKGAWLAEAALWCHWQHVGDAQTVSSTRTLSIDPNRLMKAMQIKNKANCGWVAVVTHYARQFHQRVLHAGPPFAPWPSDLFTPFMDSGDLLPNRVTTSMYRRWTGLGKLDGISNGERAILESHVRNSTCSLQEKHDGTLEYVVAHVSLSIIADSPGEELFWVQLGSMDCEEEISVRVGIPRRTRAVGDLPQEVVARMLKEELASVENYVTICGSDHQFEAATSEQEGTFNRSDLVTTIHATMDPDHITDLKAELEDPSLEAPYVEGEVYCMEDPVMSRLWYFAWLTEDELCQLSEPDREELMVKWLRNVRSPRTTHDCESVPPVSQSFFGTLVNTTISSQPVQPPSASISSQPVHVGPPSSSELSTGFDRNTSSEVNVQDVASKVDSPNGSRKSHPGFELAEAAIPESCGKSDDSGQSPKWRDVREVRPRMRI